MIEIKKITMNVETETDGVPVTLDLFSYSIDEAIEMLLSFKEESEAVNEVEHD